jgi:hypothetical protein
LSGGPAAVSEIASPRLDSHWLTCHHLNPPYAAAIATTVASANGTIEPVDAGELRGNF